MITDLSKYVQSDKKLTQLGFVWGGVQTANESGQFFPDESKKLPQTEVSLFLNGSIWYVSTQINLKAAIKRTIDHFDNFELASKVFNKACHDHKLVLVDPRQQFQNVMS